MRMIFGPKWDNVTGEWRRLHKEELYAVFLTIYHSGGQVKNTEMGRACRTYGERRGVHSVLVGKPGGTSLHGRPRARWEDNITMDL